MPERCGGRQSRGLPRLLALSTAAKQDSTTRAGDVECRESGACGLANVLQFPGTALAMVSLCTEAG